MIPFSIVLIAKNEEQSLPHLFDSIKEFKNRGGEVVILDTGSTDKTVEVAKEFGCKVEEVGSKFVRTITNADEINKRFIVKGEEPIIKNGDKLFDFSEARNYAATLASNDWIFMPDCDEVLTSFDLDKINEVIENGAKQLEYNFVFSHDQYGNEAMKFRHCKFYNRTTLKWVGIIHEVLSGNSQRTFLDEDIIKLEHFQNPKAERSKYLSGLALDCFENQEKDRNSHYFAREMLWNGRPKSAIKEFKRHIAMNAWLQERGQSCIFIGDAYGLLKDEVNQIEWYQRAFNLDSSRREALMRLAELYYKKGDKQKTACYSTAALQIPWDGYYANQKKDYEQGPHEMLYWALWGKNKEQSKYHLEQALRYQPYNSKFLDATKFYYEYPDNKIDGWMRFFELQFLYNESKKMSSVCEVGSWKGRSTHALLSGCKGTVTAVDHFKGSQQEGDYTHTLGKQEDIYKTFLKNIKGFKNLKVNKKDSLSAAKDYKDNEFDMVFIDAGHTDDEVVADIRAWRGKAKFLLCGHDFSDVWPGVKKAVLEEIGQPDGVADSIWYKIIK